MLKRLLVIAAALASLAGCASQQEKLNELAQSSGARAEVIQTSHFPIQTLTPAGFIPGKRLTIYIEGDGRAWATSTQPSLDPSPHAFSVIKLALQGHQGIYVARPCQFVMNSDCDKSVWTNARFSQAAVDSVNDVISTLKARYKAAEIELIGYSGGAAVAVLIAAARDDVTQLQTIAGNVDPVAWVGLNGLSPLYGSLDPLTTPGRLPSVPQRHFVGVGDSIVPMALAEGFVRKISARCAEVVVLQGDHASLVGNISPARLGTAIRCSSL